MRVKLAYHANCWGPLGGNAVGVTSITQLTYRTFGDMERAIREIGEELARIERAAAAAAELGAEHLVVGGGAKRAGGRQSDDFKRLGAALDKVVDIAGRAGLRAHYHPHLSTIVEGPDEVREV
ncbi:MAG: sugar phosphate isomerase/epimerase, partial [Mesorhizobium sp.]